MNDDVVVTDPFKEKLCEFESEGRLRRIPEEKGAGLLDFCSNDYLGLGRGCDNQISNSSAATSSASRLLSSVQKDYIALEQRLGELYGKDVLLFNSGYHANVGTVSALALPGVLLVADKLVHASIIDGLVLSRSKFLRFRHNDMAHLDKILSESHDRFSRIVVITESIFSMDGDVAPLAELASLKKRYPRMMLYLDEAHAFGARGRQGLGIAEEKNLIGDVDLLIGTFGKAAASAGAFVATSSTMKEYLINTARSFIFSTALPPANCAYTLRQINRIVEMGRQRNNLSTLSESLRGGIEQITGVSGVSSSHIVPLMVGDARKAVVLSLKLREAGFLVLPIRRPTVPAGTERLRFSVCADMTQRDIDMLLGTIAKVINEI